MKHNWRTNILILFAIVFIDASADCIASDRVSYSVGVGGGTTSAIANAITESMWTPASRLSFNHPNIVVSPNTIESIKLFCSDGIGTLDMLVTVTPINMDMGLCIKHEIGEVFQARLGFYTIVLAQKRTDETLQLTTNQIYRAFAEKIPVREIGHYDFKVNNSVNWSDVDTELPSQKIGLIASSVGSGSYVLFKNEAMIDGCRSEDAIKAIYDPTDRELQCTTIDSEKINQKTDDDDEKVRALMISPPGTLLVVSRPVIEQYRSLLKVIKINGFLPDSYNITNEDYTLTVPIYLYLKKKSITGGSERAGSIINWFKRALDEKTIGTDGLLENAGLEVLPLSIRYAQRLTFPY